MRRSFLVLGAMGIVLGAPSPPRPSVFLPPDDPSIRYVGRFQTVDSCGDGAGGGAAASLEQRRFSWPSSQIGVNFRGSAKKISAFLGSTNSYGDRFLSVVDDVPQIPFWVRRSNSGGGEQQLQEYTLAENLDAASNHTVTLWKITASEAIMRPFYRGGYATFGGFGLEAGGIIRLENGAASSRGQSPSSQRPLRFQFIGDSDTAGWCADGPWWHVWPFDNPGSYQDSYQVWAAQLARKLGAEMHVQVGFFTHRVSWGRNPGRILHTPCRVNFVTHFAQLARKWGAEMRVQVDVDFT